MKNNALTMTRLSMAVAVALLGQSAIAAPSEISSDTTKAKEEVQRLATVTVMQTRDETGETTVTPIDIDLMPSKTGTINDALRGQSFVQFDQASRDGSAAAEIFAPQISIRGSRPYENSYLINGLSNNNTLNPGSYADYDNADVANASGDTQSLSINTELLDSVTLLSENVSAAYGDFTGGVVDANMRDASRDGWHGKAWVRYTDDGMAQRHNDGMSGAVAYRQTEFKRYRGGFYLDGPLMDGKLGAMLSYEQKHSTTPKNVKGEFDMTTFEYAYVKRGDESRDNKNIVLRVNTDAANDFYVSATAIYAPYEAEYVHHRIFDNNYKTEGGGWNFMVNSRYTTNIGDWHNDVSWSRSNMSRTTASNVQYNWVEKVSMFGRETLDRVTFGGRGDRKMTEDTINLKSRFEFNPVELSIGTHKWRAGLEMVHTRGKADIEGSTVFSTAKSDFKNVMSSTITGSLSDGVIAGEQYAREKAVYDPVDSAISVMNGAAYLEDAMSMERVHVRAGLRMSWDEITHDTNFAPRLFGDIDLLNDDRFHVTAGFNRYFGSQIISRALAAEETCTEETRDEVNGKLIVTDTTTRVSSRQMLGDLETPYSDEFTLGYNMNILNGFYFGIQGVKRDYKKQLRTMIDENDVVQMDNSGSSSYKGITLTASKAYDLGVFGNHRTTLSATHAKTKTQVSSKANGQNMSWAGIPGHEEEWVIIDGVLTRADEMPATSFNPKWTIALTQEMSFMHDRLRTMLLGRVEDKSVRLVKVGGGYGSPVEYETAERPVNFNLDANVQFDVYKSGETTVTLDVDVLNVFDRINTYETGTQSKAKYITVGNGMGRQFFVGLSATF